MTAFQPTPAFNNQLQFPAGYGYDANEVFDLPSSYNVTFATNPATYGAPASRQADFRLLYNKINELKVPDGSRYLKPKPEQQFLRNGDPLAVDPTQPIRWTINAIAERYFIIFDLLGVFLSLMGPAPPNATSKNYFLPLVVVYARWCSALARGVKVRPTITQITWASKDNGKTWYFFLGSSSAGFNIKPTTYKALVGQTRHSYLQGILQAPWLSFGQSPSRTENGNAGTNFGNCAETYPFLYILGDSTLKNNSFGIAFDVSTASTHSAYKGENYWRRGPMMPPCDLNCQQLMKWYGIFNRLQHFQLWDT